MPALARTPVLPEATVVGALSAQLSRPRMRSATSALRRLRPSAARDPMIRQPPEVQKFPQEPAGNQDSERCTYSISIQEGQPFTHEAKARSLISSKTRRNSVLGARQIVL